MTVTNAEFSYKTNINGNKAYVKGIEITGKTDIGGIVGKGYTYGVINSICQDCTIIGKTNVGGLAGSAIPDTYNRTRLITIYNSYTDADITVTGTTNGVGAVAGGIIGLLDNKNTNNHS